MNNKEISPILKKIKVSINKIAKYEPGESENESRGGIKLSSNESPFLIPQKIKKKIQLKINQLNLYPDGDSLILKKAISKKYKINFDQIICGNGSDDILSLIGLAFSGGNSEIICNKYGFLYYPIIGHAVGAKVVFSNQNSLIIDEYDIVNRVTEKTNIVFLANPNNPTGLILEKKRLINMLEKIPPHVIIVLDGAYAEYVIEKSFSDGIELVKKFPNLIVTRTFSKIYALAGFRVGWAYSSVEIIEILEKIRGPFNVNLIAQIAAAKILHNRKFIQKSIDHNFTWRNWLQKELERLNLRTYNSFGNFLLVKNNSDYISTEKIVSELKKNNILVRFLKNYGLNNFFRVSIGLEVELKIFIRKLRIILRKN